jgi:hypothetical protein
MAKGPVLCDRELAVDRLEDAIKLASKTSDPRDKRIVEDAKRSVTMLQSLRNEPDQFDVDDEDDWDDDDDDDDPDEDAEDRYDNRIRGVGSLNILDLIRAACRRAGLDPKKVIDEIAGMDPKKSPRNRTRK